MSGAVSASYAYDAHNRRVKQTIDGQTIYTVYGVDGTLLYRDNITTSETTEYLRMGKGGRTVARLVDDGTTETIIYTHQDHLGSASSATDAAGNLLWREDYTPFGETRQNPLANANEESFTGHIRDTATGLTYMQARYYDPVIGRFLSNDPVGFAEMMAQGDDRYFNRYSYTANDPINATDPTGKMIDPGDRFPTEEEAVDDFFDYVDELESQDNTREVEERGADFIQDPETGEFYYDDVQTGTTGDVDITVRLDAVAVAHTHPRIRRGIGARETNRRNEQLSPNDRAMMGQINQHTPSAELVRSYLRTPSSRRLRWDGSNDYKGRGQEY